jgi:FkbM family methyltransferase
MAGAFERSAKRFDIASVVDVGASDGAWSALVMRHYPDANYLLVEAQAEPHGPALARFARAHPNVRYVIAAAGDAEGTLHFDASDPMSGAASREPTGPNDIVVRMTTVDAEVDRLELRPPFLLKLDTHGFEVPIFEGAATTLEQTDLLVVEAYNFELTSGSLRFHELCIYLEGRGFRCIDLVDVMHRPSDGVLWQCDLFFARADRSEFAETTYRPVGDSPLERPT